MARVKDGLVKRGSTWSYVIRVPDHSTGRSKPLWVGGFGTESEAKIVRDEARYLAKRGELVGKSQVTLEVYLTGWLEDHSMTVKAKTISGYREVLKGYVIPRIGRMKLQRIQPATLTKLYRELAVSGGKGGRPLSPGTIRQVHRALRKALNDAVEIDRLIPNNPALRTKIPRLKMSEPGQVWSMAHLRIFLASIRTHRLYAFYHLAAYTGARRGELLALRWSQVGLRERTVTLMASTDVIDGERVTDTPKSGRSRSIGIDAQTVTVLLEHRRQQEEQRARLGASWVDAGDYVFTREDGRQLYPDTVTQLMSRSVRDYNQPCQAGRRGSPRKTLPAPEILLPRPACTTCAISMPPRCSWRVRRCMWWRAGSGTPTRQSPFGSTPTSSTRAHSAPRRPSPRPSPGSSTSMTRTLMSDATMGLNESAQGSRPDRLLAKALASCRPEPRPHRANRPDNALTCGNTRADGGTRTPNPLFTRHSERISLRISAFRPVLTEHEIGRRCCWLVSVNAGRPRTFCAHGCAHGSAASR